MNTVQTSAIEQWLDASHALKLAKQDEMTARQKLFTSFFNEHNPPKLGINRIDLGQGGSIVIECKNNYTLDNDKCSAALQYIETRSAEGPEIVNGLVSWKASLKTKGYFALPADLKAIFDPCVTVKGATPSVEYEAPKNGQ